MSEYDQRQYKRMLDILLGYGGNAFELTKIIGDLEALISCLQDADQVWKQTIWNTVGVLEELNAFILDRSHMVANDVNLEKVNQTIHEIISLVDKKVRVREDADEC